MLMTVGQAEAGRLLGTVLSSDLPDLAARWLAVGLDTPALRELAGHPRHDARGVDASWRQVLREVPGLPEDGGACTGATAWVRVLPVELARWRRGEVTSEEATRRLLALQGTAETGAVAGMTELSLAEEGCSTPSSPSEEDRRRDAVLAGMAADVLL
ncbi:hypothetical protein [Kineococcus indalonis]|uniref:hypothetical protein n=1 Tax=Kineococcus indalonis TaxID=2696566 RepID=UPI001411E940|nr:hypothetical protein [Kineococcus indalonis]NAZ84992.1 hypothetical protein [Kineococcus indalonis]